MTTSPQEGTEVCVCAAIQMPDGYIIRGHRHHDCKRTANDLRVEFVHGEDDITFERRYTLQQIAHAPQGFMTTRNRFVGREEGQQLQIAAGVESHDQHTGYRGTQLYSEDLY